MPRAAFGRGCRSSGYSHSGSAFRRNWSAAGDLGNAATMASAQCNRLRRSTSTRARSDVTGTTIRPDRATRREKLGAGEAERRVEIEPIKQHAMETVPDDGGRTEQRTRSAGHTRVVVDIGRDLDHAVDDRDRLTGRCPASVGTRSVSRRLDGVGERSGLIRVPRCAVRNCRQARVAQAKRVTNRVTVRHGTTLIEAPSRAPSLCRAPLDVVSSDGPQANTLGVSSRDPGRIPRPPGTRFIGGELGR